MTSPKIWALIVGINIYKSPNVKNLRGCVNDATALRSFLQDVFEVPEQQICMLSNEEATRKNILNMFVSFLIENDEIAPEDQILFAYAGHGSTLKGQKTGAANQEAQCIVAHDSRTTNANGGYVFDIPDTTLRTLLNRLQLKNKNISAIFDSCHSASSLRNILIDPAAARAVDSDPTIPPTDLDDAYISRVAGVGCSGTIDDGADTLNYTLMAACRTDESAYEYHVEGEIYGTFTYFLLEELHNSSLELTYEEICNRVAAKVTHNHPSQHPQCEGQVHRVFFGNMIVQRDAFILAQWINNETVELKAGTILGLVRGSKVDLYEDTELTYANLPDVSIATVEVTTTKAFSAQAKVIELNATMSIQMRGLVRDYGSQRFTIPVQIEGDSQQESCTFVKRFQTLVEETSPSFIRLVDNGGVIAMVIEDGNATVYTINEEELFDLAKLGITTSSPEAVQFALQKYARYRILFDIENSEPRSKVNGHLAVSLHPVSQFDPTNPDKSMVPVSDTFIVELNYDPASDNSYIVQVINQSRVTVYLQVFVLNPDFGILRLYPRSGQQDPIKASKSLFIGVEASGEVPLSIKLPNDWDVAQDYIKVVATTDYADLGWFEQDGLMQDWSRSAQSQRSIIGQLRENFGAETRFGNLNHPIDDWGTFIFPFNVI